jgi:two-component system OmpR family response regulator
MEQAAEAVRDPWGLRANGAPLRILVVEDDSDLREVLASSLSLAGMEVSSVGDGETALGVQRSEVYDLLVVDVGLPDIDGFAVTSRLRHGGDRTPVIFLTARDELRDKLAGFQSGGDDYLTKPFDLAELIARICAVAGRAAPSRSSMEYADLTVDSGRHEVFRGDRQVDLTPTEFRLLAYLVENAEQVVTRQQILDAVWGYSGGGNSSVIENYISFLRKKVDADGPPLIRTIRGVGYTLRHG